MLTTRTVETLSKGNALMQDQTESQNGGAVAAASASTPDATQPTGSTSEQPVEGAPVDGAGTGEDNSGSSDEGDGSQSKEGERSRPSRAERRISELNKLASERLKKSEDLESENARLRELLKDPIEAAKIKLNLPDYSQQESVSPQQFQDDLKKAAVEAADQIVRMRLEQALPANNREMTIRQFNDRAYEEMQSAIKDHPELDGDSEQYDQNLDNFLARTFERVYKADPTYRFKDLVKDVFEQRGGRDQRSTNPTESKEDKGSKTALRQTTQPAKTHKPIADMTADEYKDYLRSTRR